MSRRTGLFFANEENVRFALSLRMAGYSFTQIAKEIGCDHTSVITMFHKKGFSVARHERSEALKKELKEKRRKLREKREQERKEAKKKRNASYARCKRYADYLAEWQRKTERDREEAAERARRTIARARRERLRTVR